MNYLIEALIYVSYERRDYLRQDHPQRNPGFHRLRGRTRPCVQGHRSCSSGPHPGDPQEERKIIPSFQC